MVKVITYGTFDLLHYGHIRLLERAKALGDYLIVGVTADDFDKTRGKINVQQSLMERVEAVRATGIADEIIIEEYEGQKIDDIRKYDVDIFTVGSDWVGYFDYLNEYCKVVYLERTQGVSSTEIRAEKREIRLGLVGDAAFLNKIFEESKFVNGLRVNALLANRLGMIKDELKLYSVKTYEELLDISDAIYIRSTPEKHYEQIMLAIESGKHILCESPITLNKDEANRLYLLASRKGIVLMDAIKTAYSTAYSRLLLLIKSGKIGEVVAVDGTCTSLAKNKTDWNGFYEWAPTALLPALQVLGMNCKYEILSHRSFDGNVLFSRVILKYKNSFASVSVGDGAKSEGELIISGTKGYAFVPSPWWKTDYFEIRYENQNNNKRYFYQLDGEGIRYELTEFVKKIIDGKKANIIDQEISVFISEICSKYDESNPISGDYWNMEKNERSKL